jgi:hypothetical protein
MATGKRYRAVVNMSLVPGPPARASLEDPGPWPP